MPGIPREQARKLLALLREDEVDAAIEAGLAGFVAWMTSMRRTTRRWGARDGLLAAWPPANATAPGRGGWSASQRSAGARARRQRRAPGWRRRGA